MDETYSLDKSRATWHQVDDEIVVLDLNASSYLSINETGTHIWPLLESGATRNELIDSIVDAFDIDGETAGADVDIFIADLVDRGLVNSA